MEATSLDALILPPAEPASGAPTENETARSNAAVAASSSTTAAASSTDATATPAPAIHALAAPARSLISSDQLITGAASLVRELLDNALDAGATNIALQLSSDGSGSNAITSVEARDNGCGVPVADRDMLGRPHATSKLRSFDQLSGSLGAAGLLTRGFRGEALFFTTQCAARVEFCTKTAGDTMGSRLVWVAGVRRKDLDAPVAMAQGSTVRVTGLFHNRPVRQQFHRKESQIAAQSAEIMEMMRSYAFVHPTVRFLCNNPQFNKPALTGAAAASASATDWSLAGGLTLFRASIPLVIGIMGGLANMMELFASAADTDAAAGAAPPLRLGGFITKPSLDSSASAGSKELMRSKGDRIFFYVERNRPCNLPWLAKVLVAEWRALSVRLLTRRKMRSQGIDPASSASEGPDAVPTDSAVIGSFSGRFPMILVKIDSAAGATAASSSSSPSLALDLNRSPDKRDVILGEEVRMKRLLGDLAKQALSRAFQSIEDAEQAEFAAARAAAAPAKAAASSRGPAEEQKQHDNPSSTAESKSEEILCSPILSAPSAAAAAAATTAATPHAMADDDASRFPPIAAVASVPFSQEVLPKLERTHNDATADDDEIEIISSQIVSTPHSFKASQAAPVISSPRVANPAGSTVDFSSFARPLPQPQSFMGSKLPLSQQPALPQPHSQSPPRVHTQSALPVVPMDPMAMHMAAAASSSVASAPSHSSPKRARFSAGKAAPSSASSSSPARQSQLNVVDPENASIQFSARSIAIDAEWMQQLEDKFVRLSSEDEEEHKVADESPKVVGQLADKELFVVRVASAAPASTAASGAVPSLPTLRLFSAARASESLLFSALLSTSVLPSVPLDAAIPVDDSFPGLDAAQRTKLTADVQRALELQASQTVPSGCISFVKAMTLCGFELVLDSAAPAASASPPLHLVSVPSQSSITIADFLSTLRTIWEDPCFQACGVLRVRREEKATGAESDSTAAASGSQPSAAAAALAAQVSAFAPNTNWRVDGIRAAIAVQSTAASRKSPLPSLPSAAKQLQTGTHTAAQATKFIERLQRAVAEGVAAPASEWSDVLCPHSKPVASPPLVWITAADL